MQILLQYSPCWCHVSGIIDDYCIHFTSTQLFNNVSKNLCNVITSIWFKLWLDWLKEYWCKILSLQILRWAHLLAQSLFELVLALWLYSLSSKELELWYMLGGLYARRRFLNNSVQYVFSTIWKGGSKDRPCKYYIYCSFVTGY